MGLTAELIKEKTVIMPVLVSGQRVPFFVDHINTVAIKGTILIVGQNLNTLIKSPHLLQCYPGSAEVFCMKYGESMGTQPGVIGYANLSAEEKAEWFNKLSPVEGLNEVLEIIQNS